MKDSSTSAVTDGMPFTSLSDYYKSVSDTWMNMYCNPSNWWLAQLETNSNELQINVKKRYIKFNFNL